MRLLTVRHTTTYRYARPVTFGQHLLMLRPRDSHDLRVLGTGLGVTPRATTTRWAHDVFGNSVCYLDWDAVESDTLEIVSTLDLDHFPSGVESPRETLDPAAETYPFHYPADEFPDLARLMEPRYPDPDRAVGGWARRFVAADEPVRTMDLLTAITRAIKTDFTYEAREAEGTNPPEVTLASKKGACRDFALLMMEAVRSLGFAARFVSGYLYDDDADEPTVGGGATHAWCAVYLPGAGWVEFDPTNGLLAGRNLIRVCTARTPEQAVPIAGGFVGGEDDFLSLSVDVAVELPGRVPPEPASEPQSDAAPEERKDDQAGSSSSASPTAISPPSITSA
jgi:transglutaminase-like putative cysteine protease